VPTFALLLVVAYKYLLKSTPELESTPKHFFFDCFYWCVLVALIAFSIFNRKDANYISSGNINIPGCCSSGAGYFFGTKVLLR
jgi:hypothetical protein